MSWDIRRLAIALENSALTIACAWLVISGWWKLATVLVVAKLVDNIAFANDWMAHGQPRTDGKQVRG